MAKGEAYTTGNSTFDDFFTAVREVRGEALSAPDDAEAAHGSLLRALGLDAKAATAKALEEAGARAHKLQEKGVLLHLEIAPEPKLLASRGKVDVGADGEALLKAVEGSVKSSLDMRKRLAGVAARAVELEKRRADLVDQAATAFKDDPQSKRKEVMAELDACKVVLADAGDGAGRAAGAASRFVVDLVQAVETGGASVEALAGKPGKGKKGAVAAAPRGGGGPAPRAAAAAATSPAPAPKKKAKGGDDFEP
jgi:hypothetical protein